MKSLSDIRQSFLDYFAKHGHEVVPSSSLVPSNDPTLLFTNAGMVPFKNVFTGLEKRAYTKATSAQKCVRAGGKHNDLENVGHTARHHTFFEMLGNFSFGDYFKEEAISLAWELITKEFGLPEQKLLVTVFDQDEEAARLWKKIAGLSDDRLIRISTSDNFWSMGSTGPCGPCSEIFYDHGDHIPGGPPGSQDEDGDRFIEIWNLVFMQYEQVDEDTRRDLPLPSIDTGMGLERITAVLQGHHDNYKTDLFQTLMATSQELTQTKESVSHRVIADHLRSCSFLIADGVTPSNEGRGYVLRRIMRRAMRHAHMLGCKDPLMYKLVPTLVSEMGHAYPELSRAEVLITDTLKIEEERFKQTLDKGLKLLTEATENLAPRALLPGSVAFKLYDTYGFPVDLTQDILKAQDRGVDMDDFHTAMDQQKAAARASWVGSGEAVDDQVWFDLRQKLGPTEFLGYDTLEAEGILLGLVEDGKVTPRAKKGQTIQLICNQTPFYGESGGQIGDQGMARVQDNATVKILNTTKKLGDLFVHEAEVVEGVLKTGDTLQLQVDKDRRTGLKAHHSATHLLHTALRNSLGEQVVQKGSLVAPDRLRFDFSYPKAVAPEKLQEVEDQVNRVIRDNGGTTTHLMKPDEALEAGALALFGEKYGDEVRVVAMGEDEGGQAFSTELCGGTHVHRTGDIGYFKIVSEGGIASGVRRIEALAGQAAEDYVKAQRALLEDLSTLLKTRPPELVSKVTALLNDKKKLEKDLKKVRETGAAESVDVEDINGTCFASQIVRDVSPGELKPMADALKKKVGSGVVTVVTVCDGKASLVVGVTPDLTKTISAVDLVIVGSKAIGGKGGGGRPDMAQAGGNDIQNLQKAVDSIRDHLK